MGNLGDTARIGTLESFEPIFLDTVQDVKFQLEVYVTEYSNGIDLYWAYKKHCFKPATMEYMAGEYLKQLAFFSQHTGDSFKDYLAAVKNRKTGRFKKKGR